MKLRVLLISLSLSLLNTNVNSQDSVIDSTFLQKLLEDKDLVEFLLEKEISLDSFSMKNIPFLFDFSKKLEGLHDLRNLKETITKDASISNNNFFAIVDTLDDINRTKNYFNEVRFSKSLNILNTPVELNGNIMFRNGAIDKKLSAFSIQFNQKEYLDDIKRRQSALPSIEEIFSNKLTNKEIFDQTDLHRLKTEIKYRASIYVRSKILNKVEQVKSDSTKYGLAITKIDSLVNLINGVRDTFPRNFQNDLVEKVHKVYEEYSSLENYKILSEKLINSENSSLITKLKAITTKFGIGRVNVSDNNIATNNLMLNGLNYAFELNNIYGDISIGVENFNFNIQPIQQSFIANQINGNKVFNALFGYNYSEGHLIEVGISRSTKRDVLNDSIAFSQQQGNTVYFARSLSKINNLISFDNEIAISNTSNLSNVIIDVEKNVPSSNFALESTLELKLNRNFDIGIGYFYNGPQFISFSNPFLFNNRQGITVGSTMRALDNKLNFDLDFKYGKEVSNEFTDKNRSYNLTCVASYSLNKNDFISAIVSPNVYKIRFDDANSTNNTSNIFTLSYNSLKQAKDINFQTSISYSNFNLNQTYNDTLSIEENKTVSFIEEVYGSEKNKFQVFVQLSESNKPAENLVKFDDYKIQVNHKIKLNQMEFLYGYEQTKSMFLNENVYYGFNASMNCSINKGFNVFFRFNYLNTFDSYRENVMSGSLNINYLINSSK